LLADHGSVPVNSKLNGGDANAVLVAGMIRGSSHVPAEADKGYHIRWSFRNVRKHRRFSTHVASMSHSGRRHGFRAKSTAEKIALVLLR
jgi:hypothetical protein